MSFLKNLFFKSDGSHAISRQEKMAFSTPLRVVLALPSPSPRVRTGPRALTSQPKFFGSIGFQICLAIVLCYNLMLARFGNQLVYSSCIHCMFCFVVFLFSFLQVALSWTVSANWHPKLSFVWDPNVKSMLSELFTVHKRIFFANNLLTVYSSYKSHNP